MASALDRQAVPAHPAPRLPDVGLRLTRLEIAHPDAIALRDLLQHRLADPRIIFTPGLQALRATVSTPQGNRYLE